MLINIRESATSLLHSTIVMHASDDTTQWHKAFHTWRHKFQTCIEWNIFLLLVFLLLVRLFAYSIGSLIDFYKLIDSWFIFCQNMTVGIKAWYSYLFHSETSYFKIATILIYVTVTSKGSSQATIYSRFSLLRHLYNKTTLYYDHLYNPISNFT